MRTRVGVTIAVFAALAAGVAQADPITTAEQARTVADAINLTNADLVGYDDAPADQSSGGDLTDKQLVRCAGAAPRSRQIADISSDVFSTAGASGIAALGSAVQVWSSGADSSRDASAIFSKRGRACVKKLVVKAVRAGQSKKLKTTITVTRLKSDLTEVKGMRIKATLAEGKQRINEFVDVYYYVRGQVEVELLAIGLPRPVAAAKTNRLLNLLTTRARQQVPDEDLAPGAPQQPLG